jgi:hypothetical protein
MEAGQFRPSIVLIRWCLRITGGICGEGSVVGRSVSLSDLAGESLGSERVERNETAVTQEDAWPAELMQRR